MTLARLLALLSLSLLSACAGSSRLQGVSGPPAGVTSRGSGVVFNAPEEPAPVIAAPSTAVVSSPLPPPGGSDPLLNPAPVPSTGMPTPIIAAPETPPVDKPRVAALPATPSVSPSGRSAYLGGWTAKEATGGSCKVQLSGSPALDLYKASASGCANKDLNRVTAWDYRDGEVYLYQPGGSVVARLRGAPGDLSGALAKSGAPLSLSK